MFQRFVNILQRLWARLSWTGGAHYLNGGPGLPPPLTPEEEKALLARMADGDPAARDELITHNLRLVVYLAKKYEGSGVPSEDMVSIGTIGLIKAVNTFTPERSIKLATYASRCIGNEILMYLRKSSNRRQEASIDEPLNIDGDGNELLLSDVLSSEENQVGQRSNRTPSGPASAGRWSSSRPGSGRSWSCASACWTAWSGPRRRWQTPSASARAIFRGWRKGSYGS